MKTIQQGLKFNNLSVNEATDVAQNRPLWRLDVYICCYALLMAHARKEEEESQKYLATSTK